MSIKTIWIDLDNSPHVLIFRPIIEEWQKQGVITIITARDFAQTIQLLELYNVQYVKIGRHGGKNKISKIINLFTRAFQLYTFIRNKNIDLAISHGSRTQLLTAYFLSVPSILMLDYEYTESKIFNFFATKLLMPSIIPEKRLASAKFDLNKVLRYNGLKEELYLCNFTPSNRIRNQIQICPQKILVIIRPPGMVGNYHDKRSEIITIRLIERLLSSKDTEILIITRTKEDRTLIERHFKGKVHFLKSTLDGPQLIWAADIFISGGGTMSREAALLGVPAFSIFTGKRPYVDEYLADQGKLGLIDTVEKIKDIPIVKRKNNNTELRFRNLAQEIVEIINKTINH